MQHCKSLCMFYSCSAGPIICAYGRTRPSVDIFVPKTGSGLSSTLAIDACFYVHSLHSLAKIRGISSTTHKKQTHPSVTTLFPSRVLKVTQAPYTTTNAHENRSRQTKPPSPTAKHMEILNSDGFSPFIRTQNL